MSRNRGMGIGGSLGVLGTGVILGAAIIFGVIRLIMGPGGEGGGRLGSKDGQTERAEAVSLRFFAVIGRFPA